jgi:RHS repeat-associated protein
LLGRAPTWDAASQLPVVIQDGTYSYVYGLDLISMTDGSGTQHYLSYDGLGSVSDLTDGTGAVTDTFVYDAFGAVTARTGTTATAWKFTGEQADDGSGDTGYYFLRARYYDPTTGRFISRDPVEFPQRYAYASDNPALLVDPLGLCGLRSVRDAGDCVRKVAEVAQNRVADCMASDYCRATVALSVSLAGVATGDPVLAGLGLGIVTANDSIGCLGGDRASCAFLPVDIATAGAVAYGAAGVRVAVSVATVGRPVDLMLQWTSAASVNALERLIPATLLHPSTMLGTGVVTELRAAGVGAGKE